MVNKLTHRGPDGSGAWCDESVGLGHRMLWSTSESMVEKLPLAREKLVITADARIDNRDELIPILNLKDRQTDEITDSDIILAAYERWGEQCPEKLLGDFAFAIWDGQLQKLFCARDHFGVKPFYYFASESLFVFATEIKAILCVPEVPHRVNKVRVGDYLASMFHDTTITSYQDIVRLPPAHKMTVNSERVELTAYWRLDPDRELPSASDEEYAAQFREIFTEAVRCRLRGAYPIGSTLSGGLDSSSITCTARNLLAEQKKLPLHTFSAVFDQLPDCDERKYIEPILAQGGLQHHYVQGDRSTPFEHLDKMFWHQDEAFNGPNWFMNWPLYEDIQNKGVRIVLDGFDGDTTVSDGYGYLSELARAGRWLALVTEIKGIAENHNTSFWRLMRVYTHQFAIKPIVNRHRLLRAFRKGWQGITYPVRSRQSKPPDWSVLIDSNFIHQIAMPERHQDWQQMQGHFGMHERQRHYCNIATQGLSCFALETMDKSMAAFDLEPRYPFWDKRLVEFCLALPSDQKLKKGWNRMVMRRAMTNILPTEVQWRKGKTDFSPNLTRGLAKEQLRLADAIAPSSPLSNYLNAKAVEDIYQRFLQAPSDADVCQIWVVASLALWFRYAVEQGDVDLGTK